MNAYKFVLIIHVLIILTQIYGFIIYLDTKELVHSYESVLLTKYLVFIYGFLFVTILPVYSIMSLYFRIAFVVLLMLEFILVLSL